MEIPWAYGGLHVLLPPPEYMSHLPAFSTMESFTIEWSLGSNLRRERKTISRME